MTRNLLVMFAASCALVLAGCSGGDGGDGIKPENAQALTDGNALAKKVDGNYDKLTASEKQVILKMVGGNEAQARQLTQMMAHPPNEMFGHKTGAPPGKT